MMKESLTGRRTQRRRRVFVRVLFGAGECEHWALVAVGEHAGRCLECGTFVRTPFTIHGSEAAAVDRAGAPRRSANQLAMDEVRLPEVVTVLQPCAA
jgi:hypothetical protein